MAKYLVWILLLIPLMMIDVVFRILSPFACMFIDHFSYTGYIKRLGKKATLPRVRLKNWLTWFDTMDAPTDEYWYGAYNKAEYMLQSDYDSHADLRWWFRVKWLQRNSGYTFIYKFISLSKDSKWAWHYENYTPINAHYHWNINIGWKPHSGFDKLSYAGRFFGIKK